MVCVCSPSCSLSRVCLVSSLYSTLFYGLLSLSLWVLYVSAMVELLQLVMNVLLVCLPCLS
jgi:hypothetical protein